MRSFWAMNPFSRLQWNGGYGAHSGPSEVMIVGALSAEAV
jgi:hypothetical protein